jgi:hypothetical protein
MLTSPGLGNRTGDYLREKGEFPPGKDSWEKKMASQRQNKQSKKPLPSPNVITIL